MMSHQVTVKGQVTIPKRVREYLGIVPGSGVEFEVDPNGDVLIRKAGKAGDSAKPVRRQGKFAALRGSRKTGMSTDEIMNLLRGYDHDSADPGFKAAESKTARK